MSETVNAVHENTINLDYDGMKHVWPVVVDLLNGDQILGLIQYRSTLTNIPPQIWVRNWQIVEELPQDAKEAHELKKKLGREEATSLVEIGPRFVLNPIRVFRGLFGGQTLYQNPDFVSPNEIRSMERKMKGNNYENRKMAQKSRKERKDQMVLEDDPLESVFR